MSVRDVLIVEDEGGIAFALASALRESGHRVVVASSAEEALTLAVPDVLVADLHLAGMDGLTLCSRLRDRGAAPRTVLITGEPDVESCRRALRLGVAELLPKPFAVEDLLRAVEADDAPAAPDSGPPARFARSYAPDDHAANRAARDLVAWCLRSEVGPAARARAGTALAEVVENAVRHAHPTPTDDESIDVHAELDARRLVVEVRDDGVGFDPSRAALDAGSDPRASGLARVACVAEDLSVRSAPGRGTKVRMRFGVTTLDLADEPRIDLTELDHLDPETARELLATLAEDPHAPVHLSPALAVVVGRLLAGPEPRRVVQHALWS